MTPQIRIESALRDNSGSSQIPVMAGDLEDVGGPAYAGLPGDIVSAEKAELEKLLNPTATAPTKKSPRKSKGTE